MPPRKHYAKSQEFTYQKVGKGSLGGSRQKYKLVAASIPQNAGSSSTPADVPQTLPPIVSAPNADHETQLPPDTSYYDNMQESRPKKSGKVRIRCYFILYKIMITVSAPEAIRLHEALVG